ncbi:MAG TPA: L-seryl-tRNA(Sec) selenium transferase [Euzebyales bacterium]
MPSDSDSTTSHAETSEHADRTPRAATSAGDLNTRLRGLPGIDQLLARCGDAIAARGRRAVTAALRDAVDHARGRVIAGDPVPTIDVLVAAALDGLAARRPKPLQRVLNATGVVVHTNLGRVPLAEAALDAMAGATGYCDLEYDLETGRRGSRTTRLEPLLREATGAEAAFVVNNAAAALVLALATLAGGRGVVVSRGELIEIGGSFRLPDIMGASGARLIEVGTTNRTRADDYLAGGDVGAILTLHPSNYRIVGFVARPSLPELAAIAGKRGVPLLYDTGSGLLEDATGVVADEPSVTTALRDGADVVLCSADKLLGGPQAGLLCGRADLIGRMRGHPLARALRLDKLRIAALQATLELHVAERRDEIPVWRMLEADEGTLTARCDDLADALTSEGVTATVTRAAGVPGGGVAPDATIDGPVVRVQVGRPDALARDLRMGRPAVVVRVAEDAVVIDLRTVDSADDALVSRRVVAVARPSR